MNDLYAFALDVLEAMCARERQLALAAIGKNYMAPVFEALRAAAFAEVLDFENNLSRLRTLPLATYVNMEGPRQ